MEFSAPAEQKRLPPFLAGGLSFVLHAAFICGLFSALPAAGTPESEGPLTLSLLSLHAPAGVNGTPPKSEERREELLPSAGEETLKASEKLSRKEKEGRAAKPRKPAPRRQVAAKPAPSSTLSAGSVENPAASGQGKGAVSSVPTVPFGRACGPAFARFSRPVYPLQARRAGISGLVKLRVLLDDAGTVRDIEILESGHRLLADAACEAIRRSSFRPYTENGKSLPSRTVIPIRFTLEQAL